MTNTQPLPVLPLISIGADAAVCDGDYCEIPEHHEQAVVNRAIDSGNV